ncbi:hypothetical protein [Rubritalea tangerina]
MWHSLSSRWWSIMTEPLSFGKFALNLWSLQERRGSELIELGV